MITCMKTATIPISCLNDIKDDISIFAQRGDLNNIYGMKWFYESLPRNLKALFDNI